MESRTLESLIVDYDVPPLLIKRAIDAGKLTPLIAETADRRRLQIKDISFDGREVDNLFWNYALKHKSAVAREKLVRRFQQYDGLTAAIIGAVVGSAVTSFSTTAFGPSSPQSAGPGVEGVTYHLPLPRQHAHLIVSLAEKWIGPSHPHWGSFDMLAPAVGEVDASGLVPGTATGHFVIRHAPGVYSEYRLKSGILHPLSAPGDLVFPEQPVVRFSPSATELASAEFRLWRWRSGVRTEVPLTTLGWGIFPPEWARTP